MESLLLLGFTTNGMTLASCKSALNPPVVYSTDRSKMVVPVLVLLFVALWSFCLAWWGGGGWGWGRADLGLGAFRAFVRFVFVWVCRFPLPLGVWEGLRFVIVALPGLFSYFFFQFSHC